MNADQRAIRVVHVASGDLWAGAEAQVAELVGALAKRPDLQLAAILLNEGELANRLRNAGVETFVFREDTGSAWTIYRQMVAFMRRWGPDVVHTHRQKENILGAVAARVARVPVCLRTAHGASEFDHRSWQLHKRAVRRLDRWAARSLQQRVVAVSEELVGTLRHALPGASICVIANGIDVAAVRRAAEPPVQLRQDLVHVAFIGRLVPVKRVDVFLRAAFELVRGGHRGYRFHVIGDGPMRAALERESAELGVSDYCDFRGFQADAPRWLAAMHCLVLTSDHEGLPMTALEARALGVPVVAHAVGGLVPLLQGANDCRLVASQGPRDIAEAIRSVTDGTRDSTTPTLDARYGIDATSGEYADLYQSLLEPGLQ